MKLQEGMKIKLQSGEIIKIIELTDKYVIAKSQLKGGLNIRPVYTYIRAEIEMMDTLGVLEDMVVHPKENKSDVPQLQ